MQGWSFLFFLSAAVYLLLGLVWGIIMSATGDHGLSPAHGHLNLIGGIAFAVFGVYYHLVPSAEKSRLALVHFATAQLGLLILVPGIVSAIKGSSEIGAKLGSGLVLLSMVIFLVTVIKNRQPATQ